MSISDFSLSSPRKTSRNGKDKSTYDEEFENFLNDTSESELSNKYYKKPSTVVKKPWWMKDDDDNDDNGTNKFTKNTSGSTTNKQSFLKQSKPSKQDDKIPMLNLDRDSPQSSTHLADSRNYKSSELHDINEHENERGEEREAEEEISTEQVSSSSPMSKPSVIERPSREYTKTSPNKTPDTLNDDLDEPYENANNKQKESTSNLNSQSKPTLKTNNNNLESDMEQPMNKTNLNEAADTNLLSKVMFMESINSGEGTLERPLFDKTLPINNNNTNNNNNNKTTLKSSSSLSQQQQRQTQSNENNKNDASRLNTQTRKDLADMEQFYRNLTEAGISSLIQTNNSGIENKPTPDNKHQNESQTSFNNIKSGDSEFGLRAIHAITSELENRALRQILKEIDENGDAANKHQPESRKQQRKLNSDSRDVDNDESIRDKSKGWPPDKYRNVKSSGYGTSWSPSAYFNQQQLQLISNQANSNDQLAKISFDGTIRSFEHSSRQPTKNLKQISTAISPSSSKANNNNKNNSNYSSRVSLAVMDNQQTKNDILISNLKDELVKRVSENEQNLKEIRLDYEKQLNDLRAKISNLTTQLKEKSEELSNKKSLFDDASSDGRPTKKDEKANQPNKQLNDEKSNLLEKTNKEQESLIKGYQIENERLYVELKTIKEKHKSELGQLNEQIKTLKFDLIQEKMSYEKKLKTTLKPTENNSREVAASMGLGSSMIRNQQQPESIENKIILPTNEPTLPNPTTINDYESEIRQLKAKLNDLSQDNQRVQSLNLDLVNKLAYYERNQHQIELDINIIESKNKEIKKLNEMLKSLEMGKSPPECLKQIKQLKSQLNQMDLVIKRMRRPAIGSSNSNQNPINLSLDYYEKRIDRLEEQLKEKTLDLERMERVCQQKLNFYKEIYENNQSDQSTPITRSSPTRRSFSPSQTPKKSHHIDIDKKLNEFETNYVNRIEQLENLTQNLRKILKEFEQRCDEKQNELDKLKTDTDLIIKTLEKDLNDKQLELKQLNEMIVSNQIKFKSDLVVNKSQSKFYQPNDFKDDSDNAGGRTAASAAVQSELESVRLKLNNAHNELILRDKEAEFKLKETRQNYETKINALQQKHKYELEKIIRILTGGIIQINLNDFTTTTTSTTTNNLIESSMLDDPVIIRILLNARDKSSDMKLTIEKQNELIEQLKEKCADLNIFRDNCSYLEEVNLKLVKQLDEARNELALLCKTSAISPSSSQMQNYENLKEKIKQMESIYTRNGRNDLMKGFMLNSNDSGLFMTNGGDGIGGILSDLANRSATPLFYETLNQNEKFIEMRKFYEKQLDIKNKELIRFRNEFDSILQLLYSL